MIHIVIADKSQITHSGLSSIFSSYEDLCIVGHAHAEEELIAMLHEFKTDIVFIDYTAPEFSVNTIKRIKDQFPASKVIALTEDQSGKTLVNAIRAGALSYLRKDCDIQEIIESIYDTHRGDAFYCGKIIERIRKESIDISDLDAIAFTCEPMPISQRELEIIQLIAEGYTNTEIAEKLFLSTHTVNTHRKNIMQKLGINNTAALVMFAVKMELVHPNKFLFAQEVNF
jgi:DNA-binding NarL/FixJ family response regulator